MREPRIREAVSEDRGRSQSIGAVLRVLGRFCWEFFFPGFEDSDVYFFGMCVCFFLFGRFWCSVICKGSVCVFGGICSILVVLANKSNDWSCTRGMVYNKIYFVCPGCLQPIMALHYNHLYIFSVYLWNWFMYVLFTRKGLGVGTVNMYRVSQLLPILNCFHSLCICKGFLYILCWFLLISRLSICCLLYEYRNKMIVLHEINDVLGYDSALRLHWARENLG